MDLAINKIVTISPGIRINVNLTSPVSSNNTIQQPPTLVFLHFWGGSSSTFSTVINLLSSKYPTISLDFCGWRNSTSPEDTLAYSIDQLATDVEHILSDHNLSDHNHTINNFVLIGHSMGGKVAQMVAGREKIALISLILIASAPPSPLRLLDDMKDTQIHAYDNSTSAEYVVRNVLTASTIDDATISTLVADMVKDRPEAKAAWPAYAMAEDITEWTKKINVPVLVVGGEGDQVETINQLKKEICGMISQAKLVILGGGHLIPVEKPDLLAGEISRFLNNIQN